MIDRFKSLKLFDKYIAELTIIATIVGIIAFIVVWISPETLFKIIHKVTYGEITIQQGLAWFFFEIPAILGKAIPVGLLLGTLFVTDMLGRNFELVIFSSIGISFWRLARPILIVSACFAVFCYFAYISIIPYSIQKVSEIKHGNSDDVIQWSYLDRDANGNPKQLIIVSQADQHSLKNINVFQIAPDSLQTERTNAAMKNIILAMEGEFTNSQLVLKKVVKYELLETGIYNKIVKTDNLVVLSGKTADNAQQLLKMHDVDPDSLTQQKLLEYMKLLKDEQIIDEYNCALNNFYQRFSQPLICIIFALSGLILGWTRPRENRFIGFTIGACIIFAYYLTVPFINMLAEKSILHPIITAFLPFVVITVGMLTYARTKRLI